MNQLIRWACFISLCALNACRSPSASYPETPGNLFIRQQICDVAYFKKTFLTPSEKLKAQGFLAYSLHRDLNDPKTYLITLKCSDLKKAVDYIESSNFHTICVGAGLGTPLLWAGTDMIERKYKNLTRMTGGIVITRLELSSYETWKSRFDQKKDLSIQPGSESLHRLSEKSETVLLVYETSSASPASESGKAEGVTSQQVWIGVNLEEGVF